MRRALALLALALSLTSRAQPVPITMPGATIVVPPIAIDGVHVPSPAPPSQPVEIPRPAVVTACDPGGCWDTQGRRFDKVGPLLVGPRGACNPTAGAVQCP
jgi:hypothetical protein